MSNLNKHPLEEESWEPDDQPVTNQPHVLNNGDRLLPTSRPPNSEQRHAMEEESWEPEDQVPDKLLQNANDLESAQSSPDGSQLNVEGEGSDTDIRIVNVTGASEGEQELRQNEDESNDESANKDEDSYQSYEERYEMNRFPGRGRGRGRCWNGEGFNRREWDQEPSNKRRRMNRGGRRESEPSSEWDRSSPVRNESTSNSQVDWNNWNSGKSDDLPLGDRFSRVKPGTIGIHLRRALGLQRFELPSYIYNMRRIGYPPGWIRNAIEYPADGSKAVLNTKKLPDYPGFTSPIPAGYIDRGAEYKATFSKYDSLDSVARKWSQDSESGNLRKKTNLTSLNYTGGRETSASSSSEYCYSDGRQNPQEPWYAEIKSMLDDSKSKSPSPASAPVRQAEERLRGPVYRRLSSQVPVQPQTKPKTSVSQIMSEFDDSMLHRNYRVTQVYEDRMKAIAKEVAKQREAQEKAKFHRPTRPTSPSMLDDDPHKYKKHRRQVTEVITIDDDESEMQVQPPSATQSNVRETVSQKECTCSKEILVTKSTCPSDEMRKVKSNETEENEDDNDVLILPTPPKSNKVAELIELDDSESELERDKNFCNNGEQNTAKNLGPKLDSTGQSESSDSVDENDITSEPEVEETSQNHIPTATRRENQSEDKPNVRRNFEIIQID